MALIDEVKAAANRGTASATRAAERLKLNSQMGDVERKRKDLASQLGAALFPLTMNDDKYSSGTLKPLYDAITACDAGRLAIRTKLQELDDQERNQMLSAQFFVCSVCGAKIRESDLFCSGCGTPAEKARTIEPAISSGSACPQCGYAVAEGDVFCMNCGNRLVEPQIEEGMPDEEEGQ